MWRVFIIFVMLIRILPNTNPFSSIAPWHPLLSHLKIASPLAKTKMGHSPPTIANLTPVIWLNSISTIRLTTQVLPVLHCAKPKAKVDATQVSLMLCATLNIIQLQVQMILLWFSYHGTLLMFPTLNWIVTPTSPQLVKTWKSLVGGWPILHPRQSFQLLYRL